MVSMILIRKLLRNYFEWYEHHYQGDVYISGAYGFPNTVIVSEKCKEHNL